MTPEIVVALLATFIYSRPVVAILGYDCGGTAINVTTFSLLNVGDCDLPPVEPSATPTYIQLLQLSDYGRTHVVQCRVEIDRTIYYCGMHSHISVVHNGRRVYLADISENICKAAHTTGIIALTPSLQISGLKPNSTTYRSVTLAGSIAVDGRCTGTQYSDPYGTWDDAVVQASVKISLANYWTAVKINQDQIALRDQTTCILSEGSCLTDVNGHAFWTIMPTTDCKFHQYDVLYEGPATKLISPLPDTPEIFSLTTNDITFALSKRPGGHSLCGYTLVRTEHPKLFILETREGMTFTTKKKITVDNLDIFTYVNSKFIYVEKHIRQQVTSLYQDVLLQKCELERQVLKNVLSLAPLLPQEFAYSIMKSPGYMTNVAGEVAHIIKCTPVAVKIRHTTECYQELPVTHQNKSLFLSPKSRILLKSGTIRECTTILPAMYHLDNVWYQLSPRPVGTIGPQEIKPLKKPTWKYMDAKSLATSGIYSQEDLENLRDHIMFPVERPALLHTIARGATGRFVPQNTISLSGLLNEADIEKLAENTIRKFWEGFVTFGSASAGVIMIFLILKAVRACVNTLIRGYALHSIYGWSMKLLGAVWSSITHLLISQDKASKQTTDQDTGPKHDVKDENQSDQPKPPPRRNHQPNAQLEETHSRYPILMQTLHSLQSQEQHPPTIV